MKPWETAPGTEYETGVRLKAGDDAAVHLDFVYPGIADDPSACVELGIETVRAADNIRVVYDFERDGWSILQRVWAGEPRDVDEEPAIWREVHFAPAFLIEEPK